MMPALPYSKSYVILTLDCMRENIYCCSINGFDLYESIQCADMQRYIINIIAFLASPKASYCKILLYELIIFYTL